MSPVRVGEAALGNGRGGPIRRPLGSRRHPVLGSIPLATRPEVTDVKKDDPVERSRDWFRQAERDLAHARRARRDADHEWACFAAQQAAEKAVKALYQILGGEGRGHAVTKLLEGLTIKLEVPASMLDAARHLDRLYIPTRYPNGFEEGIPGDYYDGSEADRAIEDSHAILEFVRPQIP